ncbi:MAG: hypothetical protein ABF683_01615 [Sporolactobacillus sp.]
MTFKKHSENHHSRSTKQELRRNQLLFFLLLTGFLLISGVYLWSHLVPGKGPANASDRAVTIAGKRPADDRDPSSKTPKEDTGKTHDTTSSGSFPSETQKPVDSKAAKDLATQFISQFFAYDRINPYQHLADVQSITDAGFYKELSESQTDDTHVPTYGFRKIFKVRVQTVSENGVVETVKASMRVQNFDRKNKPTGSESETVSVDLKLEKGGLKVAYFASSLEE